MQHQWPLVALTLSLCQDASEELKDFGFYIAKLLLLLDCGCCSLGPSCLRQQLCWSMAREPPSVWGS